MKKIFLATSMLSVYIAGAQDLAYKIPRDAMAVVSVKGDKLLELLSVPEFNSSFLGRQLLEEAPHYKRDETYNSIEDFGIRLNSTAYYFNQQTDSISYNCLLLPLADAQKFEQIFKKRDRDKIEQKGDVRRIYNESDNALLQWNNEYAYLVFGDLKDEFLEEDTVRAERYGLKRISYSDYYNNDAPVAAAVVDYAETVVDSVATVADGDYPYVVDTAYAAPVAEAVKADDIVEAPAYENIPVDAPPPPVVADDRYDDDVKVMTVEAAPVEEARSYYDESGYEAAYSEQRTIKKKLTREWVDKFAVAGFNKNTINNSILEHSAYQRSQDNNAAATFYLSDVQSLYHGILPYGSYRYAGMDNLMAGYGSINAKLFLNKDEMRVTSEMEVDDKKAASYKKMYNRKPNKKFAKYINSDKLVGFMSYSFDTEQYLKELPQLLDQGYGRYLGLYNDEIGMGAELFSLLLDEQAVAKVIKGDAVLLLNDIGPKEYTYTTYDYDDDYKRTEVKKKKTETLPDFLFMMSSDDTHLLERLLNYGIKKEKIVLKNGIYTLDNTVTRGNPFSVHILIKGGIVFCGTSYRDIQQISTDNYQGNISKEQKNLLLKNNMSMFFNPKNIVGKISGKEFGSSRKLRDFNTLMGNTGKMYARTTGIKNNRISGEMIAEVPEGKENALKYFFSLIEQVSRLD